MRCLLLCCAICAALMAAEAADDQQPAGEADGRQQASGYHIRVGDLLEASVFGQPELTTRLRIGTDGTIAFPLVGRIAGIGGATLAAAEERIAERLLDGYLRQATVTLQVIEAAPRLVYVMGAVAQPGAIELSPYMPMSSLEAIAQCGGFAIDADRRGAVILRDREGQSGLFRRLPVPPTDSPDQLLQDEVLRGGDLIVVPRHGRVFVIGRVRTPGPVGLREEGRMTVSQAIAQCGGFDTFAVDDGIRLIRADGGEPQRVDVRAVLDGDREAADPLLRPGDIVSVPQSRF